MRLRTCVALLALLPAGALSVAAGPEGADCTDLGDGLQACATTGYLDCSRAEGGKVHNVVTGDAVGLVSAFPEASFTTGAGCGTTEVPATAGTNMENIYDLSVAGRLEGALDTLTVELHAIDVAPHRATGEPLTLDVRAVVNGTALAGTEDTVDRLGEPATRVRSLRIDVEPVASSTGLSESFVFSLTGLHAAFPELNQGDRLRQLVELTVGVPQEAYVGPWVWGASEIPASVTMNGEVRGTVVSIPDLSTEG